MTAALQVTDLSARYARGPQVLHSLSLSLPAGQVLALLGPGGAGKTTLAQALLAPAIGPQQTMRLVGLVTMALTIPLTWRRAIRTA